MRKYKILMVIHLLGIRVAAETGKPYPEPDWDGSRSGVFMTI